MIIGLVGAGIVVCIAALCIGNWCKEKGKCFRCCYDQKTLDRLDDEEQKKIDEWRRKNGLPM